MLTLINLLHSLILNYPPLCVEQQLFPIRQKYIIANLWYFFNSDNHGIAVIGGKVFQIPLCTIESGILTAGDGVFTLIQLKCSLNFR